VASQPKPREEARVPLSRERVLRTAIDLADAGGLETLTMRRLAQELGVEAMSLYYYVANKDAILNGIADIVEGEIDLPAPGGNWRAEIRKTSISAYEILTRHPWAAGLILSVSEVSGSRLAYMNSILGTFRQAGFSPAQTDHAYHAVESHIMGFTMWEVGMNLGTREDLARLATTFLERLNAAEYPHIVEHVEQHLRPRDPTDEGEFAFGLDLILDGLERARESAVD
jgi:AcrR family transcriptional regulator